MDARSGGDPGADVEYLDVTTVSGGACIVDDVLLYLTDDENAENYEHLEYFTEGVCEDKGDGEYFVAFCASGPNNIELQVYSDDTCETLVYID